MEPEIIDDDSDMDNGPSVFTEPSTTFTPNTPLDTMNPEITRGQEQQPENLPGTPAPEPVRHLMFVRNAYGQMKCCWVVNGNQTEGLRDPTPEESALAPRAKWKALPQQGQAPAAAVGVAPVGIPQQQRPVGVMPGVSPYGNFSGPMPAENGGLTLGKLLFGAAVVGGVAWGGYKLWQYMEDKATDEELEDADDVDDETEV